MAKTSNRTLSVSCRLKELRTQKKMTQSELAGLVGIKRQAVYDIEAGRYLPNTGVALAMADVITSYSIHYTKLYDPVQRLS